MKPLLLGETIAPYLLLEPLTAIIPWDAQRSTLLDSEGALEAGYPHLASWLANAERLWDRHSSGGMTFRERLDYYRNLSAQFPLQALRVVYAKAGVRAASAIVRNNRIVIDHKLYWMPASGEGEALYLTAILNSETSRSRVEALQSEGQFGPRDFDKVMFSLPIPRFRNGDALHRRIATAAAQAERIAASVDLEGIRGFQRIRRSVRDALTDSGTAEQIDELVATLLGENQGRRRLH